MIKAEDLRIGDLVRYGEQVITIHAVYYRCIDDFVIVEETFCISCKDLEPIPITREILEKNGWKLITYDFNHVCFVHRKHDIFNLKVSSKGECLKVDLDLMPSCARICNHTFYLPKNITYVHELQHILWAFGKDANLTI